jgi:hypothetical protein
MVQLCTADGIEANVVLNDSNDLSLGAVSTANFPVITLLYRLYFVKDKSLSARDVLHALDPRGSPRLK